MGRLGLLKIEKAWASKNRKVHTGFFIPRTRRKKISDTGSGQEKKVTVLDWRYLSANGRQRISLLLTFDSKLTLIAFTRIYYRSASGNCAERLAASSSWVLSAASLNDFFLVNSQRINLSRKRSFTCCTSPGRPCIPKNRRSHIISFRKSVAPTIAQKRNLWKR